MIVVVQTARRDKMRICHSNLIGAAVHQRGKILIAARYAQRGGVCRVVARRHHHSCRKVAEANFFAEAEVHRASLSRHFGRKFDDTVVALRFFKREQGRHQLCGACGLHPFVGLARGYCLAVLRTIQNIALCRKVNIVFR